MKTGGVIYIKQVERVKNSGLPRYVIAMFIPAMKKLLRYYENDPQIGGLQDCPLCEAKDQLYVAEKKHSCRDICPWGILTGEDCYHRYKIVRGDSPITVAQRIRQLKRWIAIYTEVLNSDYRRRK